MTNEQLTLSKRGFWPLLIGAVLIGWGLIVSVSNLTRGEVLYAAIGALVLCGAGLVVLLSGIRKWRATA